MIHHRTEDPFVTLHTFLMDRQLLMLRTGLSSPSLSDACLQTWLTCACYASCMYHRMTPSYRAISTGCIDSPQVGLWMRLAVLWKFVVTLTASSSPVASA